MLADSETLIKAQGFLIRFLHQDERPLLHWTHCLHTLLDGYDSTLHPQPESVCDRRVQLNKKTAFAALPVLRNQRPCGLYIRSDGWPTE